VGDPVSVAMSTTISAAQTISFLSQIAPAAATSTHSSALTSSKLTTTSSFSTKISEVLVSSSAAITSASQISSTSSAKKSSTIVSSAALATQTPRGTSSDLPPQLKVGIGIAAGLLGIAILGLLMFFLFRILKRRQMRKPLEPTNKAQLRHLYPSDSNSPSLYEVSTPYPSDMGHTTMPYFTSGPEPEHTQSAQVQELWTPGFVPATVYERYRTSGRYELGTEGAVH
jgi:hypothetical protein